METITLGETATCEICHMEMHKKEVEIKDLDVNNLSLLAMFNIQKFHIVECPACQKSGLYIK